MLVSFAEYSLCYSALLQKRPIILRSLLVVATPYHSYPYDTTEENDLWKWCTLSVFATLYCNAFLMTPHDTTFVWHHNYGGTTSMVVPHLWWYHIYGVTTFMVVPHLWWHHIYGGIWCLYVKKKVFMIPQLCGMWCLYGESKVSNKGGGAVLVQR